MEEKGLVHIYTGDGKGKTTAAVGLACRAAGAGKKVLLVQFLKGSETGELASLRTLGVHIVRSDVKKFIPYMTAEEKDDCRGKQQDCLRAARESAAGYDLVILDECIGAAAMHMVEEAELVEFVRGKPPETELVLTGRDAPPALVALADYVSDIRCVKHPYDKGVPARKGVEY